MSPPLIALLVFLALVSVLGTLILGFRDVRTALSGGAATREETIRLRRLPRAATDNGARGGLASFDRWFLRLVRETGLGWDPTVAALLLILVGMLSGAILFLWQEEILPASLGVLIAMPVPLAYLVYRRWKRVKLLQDQLPPALEILARSIRAGLSVDQAIQHLGRNSPEPLAGEFRHCGLQMEMGLSIPAAMRSLVQRVELYDMRIFATTLIVHRQAGGNIANVMERLAHVVRDRLNYRRQLRVATAGGRISAGLVSLITPALFLFFFFFRPEYISKLFQSPVGQSMLITAVFLEIVGLVWTARLLRPAY